MATVEEFEAMQAEVERLSRQLEAARADAQEKQRRVLELFNEKADDEAREEAAGLPPTEALAKLSARLAERESSTPPPTEAARALQRARWKSGLTQTELAKRAGVSRGAVALAELGLTQMKGMTAAAIAKALDDDSLIEKLYRGR